MRRETKCAFSFSPAGRGSAGDRARVRYAAMRYDDSTPHARELAGPLAALALLALAAACREGDATKASSSPASATSAATSPRSGDPSASKPSSAVEPSETSSASAVNPAKPNSTSATQASSSSSGAPAGSATPAPVAKYGYEVVRSFPHDPEAFTQGFIFENGMFYESTGLYGSSSLRRIIPQAGQILNRVDFPQQVFAEGLTSFDGRLYMLTWKSERGIVCDPTSLQQLAQFAYSGEGWGLTHDVSSLIMSDGTSVLRFLDPKTLVVQRTIEVKLDGKAIDQLNELEFVKGEIFSNVWKTNTILRIDPKDGRVAGTIDLTGLYPPKPGGDVDDVLNGIAYDAAGDRLFVTGKRWSRVFEIKLVKK